MCLKYFPLLIFILVPFLSQAQNKGEGPLVRKLDRALDSIAEHASEQAVIGAVNGMKAAHLQQLIDSIVNAAGQSVVADVAVIRDTLLSDKTYRRLDILRDSVLGIGLARDLKQIVDTALGENLVLKTRTLIRNSIDEALSGKTKAEVAGLVTAGAWCGMPES